MDHDNDERDEAIVEARVTGVSTRALAKQHGCTGREIEEAFDRRLSYELDNRQKLRLVKLSVARIEGLMRPFYERATKNSDLDAIAVAAGTLCCKLEERLSLLRSADAIACRCLSGRGGTACRFDDTDRASDRQSHCGSSAGRARTAQKA